MPWKFKPSTFQEGLKTIGFSVSERICTTVNENILMIYVIETNSYWFSNNPSGWNI